MTSTGIVVGTLRPTISRPADPSAQSSPSRRYGENPLPPGCATSSAPTNPTTISTIRNAPMRSP